MEAKSLPADPFGLVGTLLDRKYRVERVAAAGGFGVVYAGHHLGLDRAIAIKVMRPVLEVDPDTWADGVTAFLHEAKAIASIDHPAVVGVLDAGVATLDRFPGGVPWIVLEWIDGETLEAHLAARRGRGRSPAEALALLRPVFEAIVSAHAVGILHRDLKPSNIMLQVPQSPALGPRVRVLDFGIAKLARDEPATTGGNTTTQSRSRAFSAACAAPEQISGTRTGPWTESTRSRSSSPRCWPARRRILSAIPLRASPSSSTSAARRRRSSASTWGRGSRSSSARSPCTRRSVTGARRSCSPSSMQRSLRRFQERRHPPTCPTTLQRRRGRCRPRRRRPPARASPRPIRREGAGGQDGAPHRSRRSRWRSQRAARSPGGRASAPPPSMPPHA